MTYGYVYAILDMSERPKAKEATMSTATVSASVALKCGHFGDIFPDVANPNGWDLEGFCVQCDATADIVESYKSIGVWDLDELQYALGDIANETIEV